MKKYRTIVKGILCVMSFLAIFSGCAKKGSKTSTNELSVPISKVSNPEKSVAPARDYAKDEVFAVVNTREEAEKIADLYNISLVIYEYGVATYKLSEEQEPYSLIEMGQEKGYPHLEINYTMSVE